MKGRVGRTSRTLPRGAHRHGAIDGHLREMALQRGAASGVHARRSPPGATGHGEGDGEGF